MVKTWLILANWRTQIRQWLNLFVLPYFISYSPCFDVLQHRWRYMLEDSLRVRQSFIILFHPAKVQQQVSRIWPEQMQVNLLSIMVSSIMLIYNSNWTQNARRIIRYNVTLVFTFVSKYHSLKLGNCVTLLKQI